MQHNNWLTKFFDAINKNGLSAAIIFGNFLLKAEESSETNDIVTIKKQLGVDKVKILAEAVVEANKQSILQDKKTQQSLNAVQKILVEDQVFFLKLDKATLIELGQCKDFYQSVFVALIRLNSVENNQYDVFSEFDYSCLRKVSSKQNYNILSDFVKNLDSLPIEDLKNLGKNEAYIAEDILLAIQAHHDAFELGRYFAETHSRLRKTIYEAWKNMASTVVLSDVARKALEKQTRLLINKHPEFNSILSTKRIERQDQGLFYLLQGWGKAVSLLKGFAMIGVALLSRPAGGLKIGAHQYSTDKLLKKACEVNSLENFDENLSPNAISIVYGLSKSNKRSNLSNSELERAAKRRKIK